MGRILKEIKIDRVSLRISQGAWDTPTQIALWKERIQADRKRKKEEAEKRKKKTPG